MFFGAYLLATAILFLLGLYFLVGKADTLGPLVRPYTLLTLAVIGVCLLIFVGLSAATGLMAFGQPTNWSYPQDYLAAGPVGWFLVFVSVVGVFGSLLALGWLRRPLS